MAAQNAGSMLKSGDQPRVTESTMSMGRQPPSMTYNRQPLRSGQQRFTNTRNYSRGSMYGKMPKPAKKPMPAKKKKK